MEEFYDGMFVDVCDSISFNSLVKKVSLRLGEFLLRDRMIRGFRKKRKSFNVGSFWKKAVFLRYRFRIVCI